MSRGGNRVSTGRAFESAAAHWLEGHGYRLIERNYTVRGGEIDLIMECDGKLVFIEVKARQDGDNIRRFGRPASAVDTAKREHLIFAAERYLKEHPDSPAPRLDIVEIYYRISDGFYIMDFKHYRNAIVKRAK